MAVFQCKCSPYYDYKSCCPFRLRYRECQDSGQYFLLDYDEMHNHALTFQHEIMPYPIKYICRPKFTTPNFDELKEIPAADCNSLKNQSNSRCSIYDV